MPGPRLAPSRTLALLAAALITLYALLFRLPGVEEDFWLLHDQVRDWERVQGGFLALPSHGTERTGGGHHWGPAYYGWLWLVRSGPARLCDNLPHAMGIAGAALDAASLGALAYALLRAGAPLLSVALAALLVASLPYPASLSRAGWNPSFALATVSLSLAGFLCWSRSLTTSRVILLALLAWCSVQAHSSSLGVACAVFAGLLLAGARAGRGLRFAAAIAGSILVLQLPSFVASARTTSPADAEPTAVERSVARMLASPREALDLRGVEILVVEGARLLLPPRAFPARAASGALLCAVLAFGVVLAPRRLPGLAPAIGVSILALLLAAASYGAVAVPPQRYWLLPVLAPALVLLAAGLGSIEASHRLGRLGVAALALVVLGSIPALWQGDRFGHRLPGYGPLVRGALALRDRRVVVGDVVGPDESRTPGAAAAVLRWVGGAIDPRSPLVARIDRDGRPSLSGSGAGSGSTPRFVGQDVSPGRGPR